MELQLLSAPESEADESGPTLNHLLWTPESGVDAQSKNDDR
jgi:hypothetical protein